MPCSCHPVTNAKRTVHSNPLKKDPTRTSLIRQKWMVDIRRRVNKLRAAVNAFFLQHDALGLKERKSFITLAEPQPRQFQFHTDPDKLTAFNQWFKEQVDADLLSFIPSTAPGPQGPWTKGYVESAYKKGMLNAYIAAKKAKPEFIADNKFFDQSKEQFLRDSFNQPETLSKVQLLATRSFELLKGVSAQMGSEMNRILAEGIADGDNPAVIAKDMTDRIEEISDNRAMTIARTETIYAHAEGQLDSFDELGVKQLGLQAEWSTAGDDRVCPECSDMEGEIFDVDDAHGLIPLHPNCVLGESFIECSDAIALTRTKYSGRIIHLTTSGNNRISVTEHHILLTSRGWRFAKDVKEGDEFLDASNVNSRPAPNKENRVCIQDVFDSFCKVFPKHVRRITGTSSEDFHGDGKFIDSEVNVVLADCKLWNKPDAFMSAQFEKNFFIGGDVRPQQALVLGGKSPFSLFLERVSSSADGGVGCLSIPAILARRSLTHHKPVGVTDASNRNAGESKPVSDSLPFAAQGDGYLVEALSRGVTLDKVTNIEVQESGSGGVFVFDVWSHASMYVLNGLLSSNCRCTWLPVLSEK